MSTRTAQTPPLGRAAARRRVAPTPRLAPSFPLSWAWLPVVLALGIEVLASGSPSIRAWLRWSIVVAAAVAAALAIYAAQHPRQRARVAWCLAASACAALALAIVAEVATTQVAGIGRTQLGLPDFAFVAAGLLLLGTVVGHVRGGLRVLLGPRLVLDACVVGAAVAVGAWLVMELRPSLAQSAEPVSPVPFLYAAIFVGQASAVVAIARLARHTSESRPLFFFAAAATCFAAGGLGRAAASLFSVMNQAPFGNVFWLLGLVLLGASALVAGRLQHDGQAEAGRLTDDSRLRLLPALAALASLAALGAAELVGVPRVSPGRSHLALALFAFTAARLVLALVEDKLLRRQMVSAGRFEEDIRDLGLALNASLEVDKVLSMICQTGQRASGADHVLLWMVDKAAGQLQVVEAAGRRGRDFVGRKLSLDDPAALAVRVARTGQSEVVPHPSGSVRANPFLAVMLGSECLMAVPVGKGGKTQGTLVFSQAHEVEAFGERELAKAELLAAHAAVALENARLYDRARRELEIVSAEFEFATETNRSVTASDVAERLLDVLESRIAYSRGRVFLREPESLRLRLAAVRGLEGVQQGPYWQMADERPSEAARKALASALPVRDAVGRGPGLLAPGLPNIHSALAVPLVSQDRCIGVVDLESRQPQAHGPDHERLVASLANHAALAINSLRYIEEARSVQALKELDRLKTQLLSTVTHELRTPLVSIKGYASSLLSYDARLDSEEKREWLEIIQQESDRLEELINNLMDLSSLEAGVLRIDPHPIRVCAIAEGAIRRLQPRAQGYKFSMDWEQDPEVLADPRRIFQVMNNLLDNAVKYSPQAREVRVSAGTEAGHLVVRVKDFGVGIPPEELERIFGRFHRVGGEVSERVGGVGLGLAICQGLIEAQGGRIWAESEGRGSGAVLCFSLPVHVEAAV